jgi:O-acetylserine/cysteine efflux transporter
MLAGRLTDRPASPALRVHLTLLAVQACFGGFHVVAKAVLGEIPPLAVVAMRVSLAAPILFVIAWRSDRVVPERRDWPMLALLGGLGIFANQVLFIIGLQHTTATNAAILMPLMPVVAAAAGAALGIDRVTARRWLGIGLSVAGALVMVNPLSFSNGGERVTGNLMILGNCASYALFLVLQRPILARVPWRTVIAWSFLFGGTAVLAVAGPTLAAFDPSSVSAASWAGIAYIVLLGTVFSYSANTWAVRRSSPTVVAAYSTVQPLVTAALAAVFLGESLVWADAAGFALITLGLWQTSRVS